MPYRTVEPKGGRGIDLIQAPPASSKGQRATVTPISDSFVFPCSQAQRGFWFEEQLHPKNPGLNLVARWRLDGELETATIEQAWRYLIMRHGALRTRFESSDGEPVQIVEPQVTFSVVSHDLRGLAGTAVEIEAERLAIAEARMTFDLSVAPLLRVSRIILGDARSTLLVTAHHSICDGWSVGILAREMGEICAALQRGEPLLLPELPMRYTDFAEAEHERLRNESFASEFASLRESLKGFTQFELLTDHPRPVVQTYNSSIVSLVLNQSITSKLREIARRNGCTLFMASFAALLTLLHRHSGETDIAISTQVAGREEAEQEGVVGCFINSLPLRGDLSGDPTFIELLERVGETTSESFDRRHVPFERLVSMLKPKLDLSRSALFSVNFGLHSFVQDAQYEKFSLTDLPPHSAGPLYDLNFFMVERSDGWRVSCEYNTDLFDGVTVRGLIERLELLLRSIIENPDRRISQLSLLSDADRHVLTVSANETQTEYPCDKVFTQLFAAQAMQTPDAIAIICGDVTLTYAELDCASNRLARELIRRNLGNGNLVGILLERSADLVIALLAVLKAGLAYIPLDPKYPAERLGYIIEDSRLAAVISHSAVWGRIGAPGTSLVRVDADAAVIAQNSAEALKTSARPNDLAYVIYTSGSTGRPKGVQIEHRSLVNLLLAMAASPGIAATDTLVAVTTISFDIAALEIFLPLISGARLVIANESEVNDAVALRRLIEHCGATIMQATPITWQLLIEGGWTGNPQIKMLCGGEALSRKLADQLLARGDELWNMYGPTETTIWSSADRVKPDSGPVLIGAPIANTQFYVLDANRQLAPPGVPGELFIGGDGVARGYLGRPDLTQERFLDDPFRTVPGAKLYRTGDIVRRRGFNSFEFLGRSDDQIKIRGFRIELGEIEAGLLRQPDVKEAAVIVRGDDAADKAIWAFVVPRTDVGEGSDAWIASLRSRLSEKLPYYMVPSQIGVFASLPRTPNGKIDRQALPQIRGGGSTAPEEPPANPTERALAAMFCTMLECKNIGRHDNIFDLGFHSLLAIRLVQRIEQNFGVQLELRALVDAPTVARLALRIAAPAKSPLGADEPNPIVKLNPHGTRLPFIYFHSEILAEGMYCRTMAAPIPDQPIYMVAPHGTAGLPMLPTIEAMARDLLPHIRSAQPNGPYRLGGYCMGGFVAFEVARLLRSQGESVERLIVINASAPCKRGIAFADRLFQAVGQNASLEPTFRETMCHNIARLGEAMASGPQSGWRLLAERVRAVLARVERTKLDAPGEVELFGMHRGSRATELYFAHLVAALKYRPEPSHGELILVWGTDQKTILSDPSLGWSSLVQDVRFVPMVGGHVSPLHDRAEELGDILAMLLA